MEYYAAQVKIVKFTMLANVIVKSTFFICVTAAAIHFNKPSLLAWYILGAVIGYTFHGNGSALKSGIQTKGRDSIEVRTGNQDRVAVPEQTAPAPSDRAKG